MSQPPAENSAESRQVVDGPFMRPKSEVRAKYASAVIKAVLLPALLLVDLLKRRPENEQRFLIWLFFVVFGFTFILGGDAAGHQWRVETSFPSMTFQGFIDDLLRVLAFQHSEAGTRDVYNHVISYFFGGFLELPQLYIPFVAAVYGYFFAGSVVLVLRHMRISRLNYVLVAFIVIFLFLQGLQGVQTVRSWTGLWVLVYACLKYYETGRYRYLFLMFAPPFIHFGYWLMSIPAWIVLVYGSRPLLYTSLVAVSAFTTFIPAEPIKGFFEQTDRGAASVRAYGVEELEADRLASFESRMQYTNWYNAYRRSGLQRWAPIILVLTLYGSGLYGRVMTPLQRQIFSVGVLTLAFSNMTWFLYAMHNRTLTIASIFILAGFLMARLHPQTGSNFRNLPPYYQWGLHLALLFWLPLLLFNISVTLDRMSVFALFAPFVVFIDPDLNMPVKAFLNLLLGRG